MGARASLLALLLVAAVSSNPGMAAPQLPPAADSAPPKAAPKPASKPASKTAAESTPPKTGVATKPAAPAPTTAVSKPVAPAQPQRPVDRELRIVATVDATQNWKKNDPKYPGEQWSKATSKQRYEITTRLRSEGKLEVRNLLDPDIALRMEAKTIYLARQAKKLLGKPGHPLKLPTTEQEKMVLMQKMQSDVVGCSGDPACNQEKQLYWATILAAMQYPEAMEEDTEPGRYLYFMPFKGCPQTSRVTLEIAIDGVRYNKDADKFIPFSERHSADTVDASDGLSLCAHFTAVMDTQDPVKPMWQETIFVPRPVGITEYTENNHTSREKQPQPLLTAVVDWMGHTLRHAPASGKTTASLPLPLPFNQNATWLGLWTGEAKVTMEWSFKEVPASATPPQP